MASTSSRWKYFISIAVLSIGTSRSSAAADQRFALLAADRPFELIFTG
jgi:hypothetical protein